ncbi:MAG: LysR family transcriptional regulator, partial [Alphaproteobacteria bacterium]|nr:LysR family transcriptional regulator [Alphaproteobacteria bacterium]
MDRLKAISIFVEIAERGSISSAAEALNVSRAMASRALAALEAWLGARLFHRTTRRLQLTSAGEAALVRFRGMLD